MRKAYLTVATAVSMACPVLALGGWFGPSNYEECVLDKMKNITSDVAARAIASACRKKFPAETSPQNAEVERILNQFEHEWEYGRELSSAELAYIKRGVPEYSFSQNRKRFYGLTWQIYNGNRDVSIGSLTYRYRFVPGGEWSNTYRWTFDAPNHLAPYATRSPLLENTSDLRKVQKLLSQKGSGVELQLIEGKTAPGSR